MANVNPNTPPADQIKQVDEGINQDLFKLDNLNLNTPNQQPQAIPGVMDKAVAEAQQTAAKAQQVKTDLQNKKQTFQRMPVQTQPRMARSLFKLRTAQAGPMPGSMPPSVPANIPATPTADPMGGAPQDLPLQQPKPQTSNPLASLMVLT